MNERETEELRQNIEWWKNRYMSLSKRHKELQQRINEALKLLEYVNKVKTRVGYNKNEKDCLDKLVEILKGASNE